jgi:hypothetical protein
VLTSWALQLIAPQPRCGAQGPGGFVLPGATREHALKELLWLTCLAGIAGCAAMAHESVIFTTVFAIATGLGGAEIVRRAGT